MKKLLFALVLLLVAAGTLQAQDVYQWFATDPPRTGPPTTDWTQQYAWFTEVNPITGPGHNMASPGANDKVKIFNVAWGDNWEQYSPNIGGANGTQNIQIGDIFMGDGGTIVENLIVSAGGTLTVNGADSSVIGDGQINLAYAGKDINTLLVNGGTVNVDGVIHVGWGGAGALTINGGGTVNVLSIDIGGNFGTGHIAVDNGTLVVAGFLDVNQWLDDGLLTSNGSADNVVVTYDEVADQTIITPEPVSIALLGLGALILRKRS